MWMARFDEALMLAQANRPRVSSLCGAAAAQQIFASGFAEPGGEIASWETLSLRKGD